MRLRRKILLSAIFILCVFGAGWFWRPWKYVTGKGELSVSPETVKPAVKEALPDFMIAAVQVGEDGREVIKCEAGSCQPLPMVDSVETDAVTDGQSWYYYQYRENGNNGRKVLQLKRTWIGTDKSELITEQTPLVKPRGLYISPDSQQVAFWLDDVSSVKNPLTELWVYDAQESGKKLVAEKIVQSDVLTQPNWNRSSSWLWFMGKGEDEQPRLQLLSVKPPSLTPASINVEPALLSAVADGAVMDVSPGGKSLALAQPQDNRTWLKIIRDGVLEQSTALYGGIPYVSWLDDGSILYAVQGKNIFNIWQLKESAHRHVLRQPGELESIRADAHGDFLIMAVKNSDQDQRVYAVDVKSGQVEDKGALPRSGEQTFLVHFEAINNSQPSVAGIQAYDDEQIIAFIDSHLEQIAQEPVAPVRLVITKESNTVLVDYRTADGASKRLMISVMDVLHDEWSVKARYVEQGKEWVKVQGGRSVNPAPSRLYEWEDGLNQWILKETLVSSN